MNTTPHIKVGVGVVVIDNDGKLLLGKRGHATSINSGLWESPGGGVEFGETLEAAARREAMEELGIEIEIVAPLQVVEFIKDDQHIIGPAFVCKIASGTPKICEPDKCEELGWFTVNEAKQLDLTEFAVKDIENYENWLRSNQLS